MFHSFLVFPKMLDSMYPIKKGYCLNSSVGELRFSSERLMKKFFVKFKLSDKNDST